MAYDGKILRRAYQKFEEDRQQRQERFQSRRESIFLRQPRLRQIEGELRTTMSRIIASALRRGTDPLPAVEVLKEENLGLQEEKRRLPLVRGLRLPGRTGVPVPAQILCPGAAEGAQPDAGSGRPEL